MFSPLSLFTGPYGMLAKWGVIALIALACAGFGAAKMHTHDQKKYDALDVAFETFKTQTAVLGQQAALAAKAKAAQDKLDKEKVDAKFAKDLATVDANIVRLRRELDGARSSIVPPAPPNSSRPELACFDRSALESANRELFAEIRAGADEGTKDTIALNAGKTWAQTPATQ